MDLPWSRIAGVLIALATVVATSACTEDPPPVAALEPELPVVPLVPAPSPPDEVPEPEVSVLATSGRVEVLRREQTDWSELNPGDREDARFELMGLSVSAGCAGASGSNSGSGAGAISLLGGLALLCWRGRRVTASRATCATIVTVLASGGAVAQPSVSTTIPRPFYPEGEGYSWRSQSLAAHASSSGVSWVAGSSEGTDRLRWRVLDATEVKPVAEEPLGYPVHVLVGDRSRWRRKLTAHRLVRWKDLRPGVDLVLDSGARSVEWRAELDAGVPLKALVFHYEGARGIERVESGRGLLIKTGSGAELRERGLRVFQRDADGSLLERAARYVVNGDRYRVEADDIDPRLPTIIDPTVDRNLYVGGSDSDAGGDLAVSPSGDVFLAGSTLSADLSVVAPMDGALGGTQDAFVVRYDGATLTPRWMTYLGGSGSDAANGLAVDATGHAFVVGSTESTDFPANGGFDDTPGGARDGFLGRLNPDGTALEWAAYIGGNLVDNVRDVALDSVGGVVVTGNTDSTTGFPLVRAIDATLGGATDSFALRATVEGALDWSTLLGGSDVESGIAVAIDPSNNVYLGGQTRSLDFAAFGAFDTTFDSVDGYVAKLEITGPTMAWSTFFGGTDEEYVLGLAADSTGVYLTGITESPDLPLTPDAFRTALGGIDGFLARLTPDGALAFSSYVGGDGVDWPRGIAVAGTRVYLAGFTESPNLPNAVGALSGTQDGLLVAVDLGASPVLAWSRYEGGSGIDSLRAIAIGSDGVYATGSTSSADVPDTSPGALSGPDDGFVVFVAESSPMPDGGVDAGVEPDAGADAGVAPDAGLRPRRRHRRGYRHGRRSRLLVEYARRVGASRRLRLYRRRPRASAADAPRGAAVPGATKARERASFCCQRCPELTQLLAEGLRQSLRIGYRRRVRGDPHAHGSGVAEDAEAEPDLADRRLAHRQHLERDPSQQEDRSAREEPDSNGADADPLRGDRRQAPHVDPSRRRQEIRTQQHHQG